MRVFAFALLLVFVSGAAFAEGGDMMPPPQKAPRTPVQREALPAKEPREFEGRAKSIDGERLIINSREVRLFGIVTPSLSSNFGPQARSNLDQLLQNNIVLCKTTDRDKEGRPIAFCGTVDVPDISFEMLKRGWAMVDRKAIKGSSLMDIYEKAEQEALSGNKGLFAPQPMANVVPLSNPAKSVVVPVPENAAPVTEIKADTKIAEAKAQVATPEPAPAPVAEKTPEKAPALFVPATTENAPTTQEGPSFIERFQTIISAMLALCAAAIFAAGFVVRGREELVAKRKALAAALRGEVMAARHICRTRAKELSRRKASDNEAQPRPSQLWPRIRTLVYQAHVGSIGFLGAELARQVASVYGQCADYTAYYQSQQRLPAQSAVSETLSTLADHMEIVLEGLAVVESTGQPYRLEAEEGAAEGAEDDAATTSAAPSQTTTPAPTPKRSRSTKTQDEKTPGTFAPVKAAENILAESADETSVEAKTAEAA